MTRPSCSVCRCRPADSGPHLPPDRATCRSCRQAAWRLANYTDQELDRIVAEAEQLIHRCAYARTLDVPHRGGRPQKPAHV